MSDSCVDTDGRRTDLLRSIHHEGPELGISLAQDTHPSANVPIWSSDLDIWSAASPPHFWCVISGSLSTKMKSRVTSARRQVVHTIRDTQRRGTSRRVEVPAARTPFCFCFFSWGLAPPEGRRGAHKPRDQKRSAQAKFFPRFAHIDTRPGGRRGGRLWGRGMFLFFI